MSGAGASAMSAMLTPAFPRARATCATIPGRFGTNRRSSVTEPVATGAPLVLLIYDSRGGLVEELADSIADGVRSVPGVTLRSRRIDEANPEELLDCVPHARIVRFDDCGHFPDLERPERFASLLIEHVARYA